MDREQTPLKQRQKRSAAGRTLAADQARPFRSSASTVRQPRHPSSKPPLTILRSADTPAASKQLRVSTSPPPPAPAAPLPSATAQVPSTASSPATKRHSNALQTVVAATALRPLAPTLTSPTPPLITPPNSITKLITPTFQFAADIPSRLATCLELSQFTVIGALGFPGAGTSSMLSAIGTTMASQPFFTPGSETQGVDLAVACEAQRLRANCGGLVLLEPQPLLSAAHVADAEAAASASSSSRFTSAAVSHELQHELASEQLAVLLLSVCHYVVLPSADLALLMFLRKVHAKMQQCRLPSVHSSGSTTATMTPPGTRSRPHQAQLLVLGHDEIAARGFLRLLPPEWSYDGPALPSCSLDQPSSVKRWADAVASLPSRQSSTLKEWLSGTARVWESVKRSSAITDEYYSAPH